LIGRQLGDNFGDFFDFHVAQYSTAGRINLRPRCPALPPKADIIRRGFDVRFSPEIKRGGGERRSGIRRPAPPSRR
jgi:hypothetical protein